MLDGRPASPGALECCFPDGGRRRHSGASAFARTVFEGHRLGDTGPGSERKRERQAAHFGALPAARRLSQRSSRDDGGMPPAHKLVWAECGRHDAARRATDNDCGCKEFGA
jgi:hypothetical protein